MHLFYAQIDTAKNQADPNQKQEVSDREVMKY